MLEKFMSFAQQLPADRLASVEVALAALMTTYSDGHDFSATELDTLRQRVAEDKPAYADPGAIAKLFGKPFSA